MSCCPPGSAPSFADEYSPVGITTAVSDVEFYAVGNPSSKGRAIIIIPDIWGWNSGRIRRMADLLASNTDSYVAIPKLLQPAFEGGTDGDALPPNIDLGARGAEVWPWLGQFKYTEVLQPKIDAILGHFKDIGIEAVGSVGFCFGGWVQAHMSADHDIKCMVTPHPSIHSICGLLNENQTELLANIRKVPWLLMPAGNDPAIYLPGGEVHESLKAKNDACRTVAFPDMTHGWSIRGDVSNVSINRDVLLCYSLMEEFLKENLN